MKGKTTAIAILFMIVLIGQQAEAGKMKKLIKAAILAGSLKPRFIPIPIPIPFKLKINKGERTEYYSPMKSYGMGGGGGYGMMGGGGGGYGMMGMMGGGYGMD